MRRAAALGMILVLAGCGASSETIDEPTTLSVSDSSTTESTAGASTASSLATTASRLANPPSTTTGTMEARVVLEAAGLGLVDFGEPFEAAMAKLEAALGAPTHAGQIEPDSPTRTEYVAYWEDAGLRVGFSASYPVFRTDGQLHFTWWHTDWAGVAPPLPLTTAGGIGVESTLLDLQDTYGDRFWINSDECAPPGYIAPDADISSGYGFEERHPRWIDVIRVGFDQPQRWADDGSRYFDDPELARVQDMAAGASDGC